MAGDVLFECKMDTNTFKLYRNRLEVIGLFKTQTFFIREITSVTKKRFSLKEIEITTSSGKSKKLPIAGAPAEELRQKILELL